MKRLKAVVFLFSGLWLLGQQVPRVQGPRLPPQKQAPRLLPRQQDQGEEGFTNFHGTPTHNIHNCIPGRVNKGFKGQTRNVPCECLHMVEKAQSPLIAACDDKYAQDDNKKAWMACREAVPHCSRIVERGFQEFWGENYRFRCQTYCKDQNCECCDDGRKEKNQARHHGIMVVHMLSLQPGLRPLLTGTQACRERDVLTYSPTQPAHLFYGLATAVLR